MILSGGEALLREDWEQIARCVAGLGMKASLISNGFVIDAPLAGRIKEAGICRVALSFDGMEDTHNTVRDNRDSFRRVCRAARFLKDQEVPVNFVTHVNRINLEQLPAMEVFIESLKVDVWRLQLGAPVGRLGKHPELIIDPEQLPSIADFIVQAKKRARVVVSVGDNIGYFSHHEPVLRDTQNRDGWNFWCGCSAGCLNIGIEANDNVKGCLSLQSEKFVEGNIRREPLASIWRAKGNFSYTREFKPEDLHGHCEGCPYGEICRGGCVFMAFGATGSPHNNPYCLYRVMGKQQTPPRRP